MVDIKVDIDIKKLEKKVGPQAVRRGQIAMTSQMLMDMNQYVPIQSGELREKSYARVDTVVWHSTYARIQFYGKKRKGFFSKKQRRYFFANKDRLLNNKRKRGTGTRWDQKAARKHMKDWEEAALKGMGIDE
ncbi:minor capsid protein [Streptococcus sp. 10F2]